VALTLTEPPMREDRDIGAGPDSPETHIEQFRDRIRFLAVRRLHSWSEAEDVAQETLRRTLEALRAGRIRDLAALPSFLFSTAIHICQNQVRLAGREERALRHFASNESRQASEQSNQLQALISEERMTEVRRAMQALPEDDRKILVMTYVENLPSMEIGKRLDLSEGNVRVRRHRAIQRLAQLLRVTRESLR